MVPVEGAGTVWERNDRATRFLNLFNAETIQPRNHGIASIKFYQLYR